MNPSLSLPRLAFVMLAAQACVIHVHEAEDEVYVKDAFDAITAEVDAGSILVRIGPEARVASFYQWSGDEPPEADVWVSGGVLHVYASCEGHDGWKLDVCTVDMEIEVPEAMAVDLWTEAGDLRVEGQTTIVASTSAGDIEATDITSDACLETEAGDVTARRVGGPLSIFTDAGDIEIEDVDGSLEARTAAGDIEAHSLRGPDSRFRSAAGDIEVEMVSAFELLQVRSDVGDLRVDVPEGVYDLDLDADIGDVDVTGVERGDSRSPRIEATTSVGDIRVVGR
jgi:hypothetical protein